MWLLLGGGKEEKACEPRKGGTNLPSTVRGKKKRMNTIPPKKETLLLCLPKKKEEG